MISRRAEEMATFMVMEVPKQAREMERQEHSILECTYRAFVLKAFPSSMP